MSELHRFLHSLAAAHAPAVWAHLWTSTLVLAAALLVATWRRLSPGAREAILSLGLAKLLLPGTAILLALRALGWDLGRPPSHPVPAPFSTVGAATPIELHPAGQPSELLCVAAILWLGGAAISILARTVRRRALLRALLHGATPAGVTSSHPAARGVAILRGRVAGPFTFGTWRPVIVLPAEDDLEPAMERPLLAHELAHVRRRDDLRASITSLVAALFWFHPLVWIAGRRLALAREAACDRESTREVGLPAYLAALDRVCRGATSPAGLTGWATGALRERIELLMEAQRLRFASPRLVVAVACLATTLAAVASGFAAPLPPPAVVRSDYALDAAVTKHGSDFLVSLEIKDPEGTVLARPQILLGATENASMEIASADGSTIHVRPRLDSRGRGYVRYRIQRGIEVLLDRTVPLALPGSFEPTRDSFDPSNPISFSLRDADLHDVLWTFARMAGLRLDLAGDISGSVTIELDAAPWAEALDRITSEAGLQWQVDGDRLVVVAAG